MKAVQLPYTSYGRRVSQGYYSSIVIRCVAVTRVSSSVPQFADRMKSVHFRHSVISSHDQEHFQQYLNLRARKVEASEYARSDKLDAVEAGDGDDDDDEVVADSTAGFYQSSSYVTPYGGVGPLTVSTAEQVKCKPHGTSVICLKSRQTVCISRKPGCCMGSNVLDKQHEL